MLILERSPTSILSINDRINKLVKRVGVIALSVAANNPKRVRRYILDLLKDISIKVIGLSRINTSTLY